MMRVVTQLLTFGLLAALCQPGFASDQKFKPNANGGTEFMAPSGNIGCIYIPAGGTEVYEPEDGGPELQCDRVGPVYLRFILNKAGKAKIYENAGDVSCCGGPVLRYGNTTRLGPFTCVSETSGMTCTRGDRGFFISRKKTKAW
jgi:hypothetical protein